MSFYCANSSLFQHVEMQVSNVLMVEHVSTLKVLPDVNVQLKRTENFAILVRIIMSTNEFISEKTKLGCAIIEFIVILNSMVAGSRRKDLQRF